MIRESLSAELAWHVRGWLNAGGCKSFHSFCASTNSYVLLLTWLFSFQIPPVTNIDWPFWARSKDFKFYCNDGSSVFWSECLFQGFVYLVTFMLPFYEKAYRSWPTIINLWLRRSKRASTILPMHRPLLNSLKMNSVLQSFLTRGFAKTTVTGAFQVIWILPMTLL